MREDDDRSQTQDKRSETFSDSICDTAHRLTEFGQSREVNREVSRAVMAPRQLVGILILYSIQG